MLAKFFLLLLLTIAGGVVAEDNPCTLTDSDNGKFYDLSGLKTSKDFELRTQGGHSLYINVCQSVRTETFGLKDNIDAADVASFIRLDHGDFSLGKVNTTLSLFDSKPRMVFSDGSKCKSKSGNAGDMSALTVIDFTCDESVHGVGGPRLVAQLPPWDDDITCGAVLEWRTHLACSTNTGSWGVFTIIAVIFLTLLMTYTVLGTLYNRYVLQLRGFDQIPQFSLESMRYHGKEAIDWLKDIISGMNVGQRGAGGDGGAFGSLSADATNPVSHHSQAGGMHFHDEEAGAGGGFVRPQQTGFQKQTRINPFSHHVQVQSEANATRSLSYDSPAPPPPSKVERSGRELEEGSKRPASEHQEFMLGDDEEGEEMGIVNPPVASPGSQQNILSSNTQPSNNSGGNEIASVTREQDQGVIRL